jgi:hypothetical protein
MKKLITLGFFLVIAVNVLKAQAAKSVFFELGGPGLASFNFDTRFGNREDGLGGRIGVGGFSVKFDDQESEGVVFIPIGLNYLIGHQTKHYFEVGAGITPVIVTNKTDGTFGSTFGHLNFGYRLQPPGGGFTFRAFITPVFGSFGFIPYYGGVSFGFKFGNGSPGGK